MLSNFAQVVATGPQRWETKNEEHPTQSVGLRAVLEDDVRRAAGLHSDLFITLLARAKQNGPNPDGIPHTVQPLLPEYTPFLSQHVPEMSPVISMSKSRTAVLVGALGKMEM